MNPVSRIEFDCGISPFWSNRPTHFYVVKVAAFDTVMIDFLRYTSRIDRVCFLKCSAINELITRLKSCLYWWRNKLFTWRYLGHYDSSTIFALTNCSPTQLSAASLLSSQLLHQAGSRIPFKRQVHQTEKSTA